MCWAELAKHVPEACGPELIELARFAASNLEGMDSSIVVCADLQSLPGLQVMDRAQWEGACGIVVDQGGYLAEELDEESGISSAE